MLDRVEEIGDNIGYFENTYIFISGNLVQKKNYLIIAQWKWNWTNWILENGWYLIDIGTDSPKIFFK